MPAWTQRLTPTKVIAGFFILLVWLGFAAVLAGPTTSQREQGWDYLAFWLAPRLLLQGESPYDAAAWAAGHAQVGFPPQDATFLYPLHTAVLLLPFGALPLMTAAFVWTALILGVVALCAVQVLRAHVRLRLAYALPILAGVFLFRPTAVLIFLLQIDWIVLGCAVAAWTLWRGERWFLGGLVLGLVAIKPQVGGPLLAVLGIWQIVRTRWTAVLGEGLTLAGLLVLALAFDPGWVGRWLAIGGDKAATNFYSTPTLWGLTALACQPSLVCVQWLGTAMAVLFGAGTLWLITRRRTQDLAFVMGTAICGVLFITPFLWIYSQTLLVFPLLVVAAALYRLGWPYLVTASYTVITALVSLGLLGVSILVGADLVSGLLPVLVWVPFFLVDRRDPGLLHAGLKR